MVRLISDNHTFVSRFDFVSFDVVDINEGYTMMPHSLNKEETLEITYLDDINKVTLKQYISTFADSDVLVFQNKVINSFT